MILSSKVFQIPKEAKNYGEIVDAIEEWLYTTDRDGIDTNLVMTLEVPDERRKKNETLDELQKLAEEAKAKKIGFMGIYEFNFIDKIYFWGDREIYLTANEQLFLFRLLVLKEGTSERQRFYLRNMRRRLGKEFLIELKEDKNGNT